MHHREIASQKDKSRCIKPFEFPVVPYWPMRAEILVELGPSQKEKYFVSANQVELYIVIHLIVHRSPLGNESRSSKGNSGVYLSDNSLFKF